MSSSNQRDLERRPVHGPAEFAAVPSAYSPHANGVRVSSVLDVVRHHLGFITLIIVATVAPALYLASTERPTYQASGLIRLVDTRHGITGGIDNSEATTLGRNADPLLSQIQVLMGRSVGAEVVHREALRLRPLDGISRRDLDAIRIAPDSPSDSLRLVFRDDGFTMRGFGAEVPARYGVPATIGGINLTISARPNNDEALLEIVPLDFAIDSWSRKLTAEPLQRTDVILVSYAAGDPLIAQRVVNATIEVFQSLNAQSARQQSMRRRIFLERHYRQTDSILSETQLALSGVRSRERVYSSQEKMTAQQQSLLNLDMRREEIAAERRMYEQLLADLQHRTSEERSRTIRTMISAPGVAANPVVSHLFGQLVQYQAEYARLTSGASGSTSAHPDVQRYSALIASAEAELIDAVRSYTASLEARIGALDVLRSRSSAELERLPHREAEELRLVQQLETLQKVADQVLEELQQARVAEAVEAGQVEVVYLAPLPTDPINTRQTTKIGMSLVLGLLLGIGGAFIRESSHLSIRRREEVDRLLHVNSLAVIPRAGVIRKSDGWFRALLPTRDRDSEDQGGSRWLESDAASKSGSAYGEAFRMLYTNLSFSQADAAVRVVAVTSAAPGDGKTTTAVNLAITLAQHGHRVLLVDCDLRRGKLHRLFHVDCHPGLRELVLGEASPGQAIRATAMEGLFLLTAGALSPGTSQVLGGTGLRDHLEQLASSFDRVILDTPPLLSLADASILSTLAGGVLFVVRAGQTQREAAQHALQQLSSVRARVIGAVLNDPDSLVDESLAYYDAYASTSG